MIRNDAYVSDFRHQTQRQQNNSVCIDMQAQADILEKNKNMVKTIVEKLTQKDLDKSLALYPAFSDFQVKVTEQSAIGNRVVSRWVISARHTGSFLGIAPSGKSVVIAGISIHKIEHDKIAEDALEIDFNDLTRQMSTPFSYHTSRENEK
jgi:predicted ester cyclase